MPREVIYEELPNRVHWKTFLDLKRRWKCSIKALLKRTVDLEVISEDQYKRGTIATNGTKVSRETKSSVLLNNLYLCNALLSFWKVRGT